MIIEKYYTSRWHKKGITRSENTNKTTEAQEKANLRKAIREVTILLNANGRPGDYHLVLDYQPDNRPDTPREGQTERRPVHPEDETDIPEGWRRTEISGGSGVRKKGRAPSSHFHQCMRWGRGEGLQIELAFWKDPFPLAG